MVICFMYDKEFGNYVNPQFFPNREECVSSLRRSILHEFFSGNLPEIDHLDNSYEFKVFEFDQNAFIDAGLDSSYTFRPFYIPPDSKEVVVNGDSEI